MSIKTDWCHRSHLDFEVSGFCYIRCVFCYSYNYLVNTYVSYEKHLLEIKKNLESNLENKDRDQSPNLCLYNTADDDKFCQWIELHFPMSFQKTIIHFFIFFAISHFEIIAYFNALIIFQHNYNFCF